VPPAWETHGGGGGDCILILRVEFGSLKELVEELCQRLRGVRLAAGSLVLLFSASHLAAVGTAAYCSDLVEATEMVKRRLGPETVGAALPPIFLNGCGDGPTIRSAVEVGMWAARFFNERTALKNTMKTATDIMAESGADGFLPATSRRLRLPYGGGGGQKVFVSDGTLPLPVKLAAVTVSQEKRFFLALAEEVRASMAFNLDIQLCIDRSVQPVAAAGSTGATGGAGGGSGGGGGHWLVVGGSNAKLLTAAAREAGIAAEHLHLPSLRIIRGAGDMVAQKLKDEVSRKAPATVVLQLFDNSSFEALTVEGTRIPPRKSGGKHHLDGDIKVAEKATVVGMLRICRPVFNATAGINTVFVGPMPRYVAASCCTDSEHMANRAAPNFLSNMIKDLATVNRAIKEFLHADGYENIRSIDPWIGLRDISTESLWGTDPVHIKHEHFPKIVEGVKIALTLISQKRKNEDPSGGASKRRRVGSNSGGSGGGGGGGAGSGNSGNGSGGGDGSGWGTGGGSRSSSGATQQAARSHGAGGDGNSGAPRGGGGGGGGGGRGGRGNGRGSWRGNWRGRSGDASGGGEGDGRHGAGYRGDRGGGGGHGGFGGRGGSARGSHGSQRGWNRWHRA
jgi:hypothetical protein